MLKLLTLLFGFLDRIGAYLATRQSLDAGKAEQKVEEQRRIEANVQKSELAVTVRDGKRTERLRSRFDAGYGNE